MTHSVLGVLLQPVWLVVLVAWSFIVLSAVQLTIRLILAYSVGQTLLAAVVLSVIALPIAGVYDLIVGPQASVSTQLDWAPLPIVLMGMAGFGVARWVLRLRRLRGQIAAGIMIGVLDPHIFTLLAH